MLVTAKRLNSKDETGQEMHRLIKKYFGDIKSVFVRRGGNLIPFSSLPIKEAFNIVRKMPYKRDVAPIEIVSRPYYVFKNRGSGSDCKKKAIVMASYLKSRGIPYRLIASSRKRNKRIHHVFPQMGIDDVWINLDATYSNYKPFESKAVTRAEVLQ